MSKNFKEFMLTPITLILLCLNTVLKGVVKLFKWLNRRKGNG